MTSSETNQVILENYNVGPIVHRIQQALEKAGLGSGSLLWSDLAQIDQFHVRGLEATRELAAALNLKAGQSLLDIGSGLGGPARYLAAVHGVQVTGLDLMPAFVEASEYLSARAGLREKTTFRQGDAVDLPFANEAFDACWTQHVAMNIEDKQRLYEGIYRVLKPGAQFAIYDAIQGNGTPLLYPTPWARDESISFVATEAYVREALSGAGFQIRSFADQTETAAQWFRVMQQQRGPQTSQHISNPLNLATILGAEMGPAIANFAQNVLEGRVRIMQIIAEK